MESENSYKKTLEHLISMYLDNRLESSLEIMDSNSLELLLKTLLKYPISTLETEEERRNAIEVTEAVKQFIDKTNSENPISPYLLVPITSLREEDNIATRWLWDGYLAFGCKSLLAAWFKVGKSTLIASLLQSIDMEESFLGLKTERVKVAVISEESKGKWFERLENFHYSSNIFIITKPFKSKPSNKEWINFIISIRTQCEQHNIKLVILDTITKLWPVFSENDADQVTQAMIALDYLTEIGIAVLLIHHTRKNGGENGLAIRGSGALGSDADIIINYERGSENSTERKLKTQSRFDETPDEMIINYDEYSGKYTVIENTSASQKILRYDRYFKVFQKYGTKFTIKQILEFWDIEEFGDKPSVSTIERAVKELIKQNVISFIEQLSVGKTKANVYKVIDKSNEQQSIKVKDANHDRIEERFLKQNTNNITADNNALQNISTLVIRNDDERSLEENTKKKLIQKPCTLCHNTLFWRQSVNNILCSLCHPPISEEAVIEWIECP